MRQHKTHAQSLCRPLFWSKTDEMKINDERNLVLSAYLSVGNKVVFEESTNAKINIICKWKMSGSDLILLIISARKGVN